MTWGTSGIPTKLETYYNPVAPLLDSANWINMAHMQEYHYSTARQVVHAWPVLGTNSQTVGSWGQDGSEGSSDGEFVVKPSEPIHNTSQGAAVGAGGQQACPQASSDQNLKHRFKQDEREPISSPDHQILDLQTAHSSTMAQAKWQSPTDAGMRLQVARSILMILRARAGPTMSKERLLASIRKLEVVLYCKGRSRLEYMDRSTLEERVLAVVKQHVTRQRS